MKIRIGISAGGDDLGPEAMAELGRSVSAFGFASLWLPEVLSRPGPGPLGGLAWASGACPGLKIGTTMLLPGRNLVWLAKAVATLDLLSAGRFLLTFVPGLAIGGGRGGAGGPPARSSPTTVPPARSPRSPSHPGRSKTPSTYGSAATCRRRWTAADGWATGG